MVSTMRDPAAGLPPAPYLLTPGPLNTSAAVKAAMLRDWGSRDEEFREMTGCLRSRLLDLAGNSDGTLDCVPLQGSGTYVVEAMLGSLIPRNGRALVLVNGAYGRRIVEILRYLGRDFQVIDGGDYRPPRGYDVDMALGRDPEITHVVAVHCETSSGILNPIEDIAAAVSKHGRSLLIDSMSAFGALPTASGALPFDALAASANKCLESVPGIGFVIARKPVLEAARSNCHSLSLDLHAQWTGLNRTRQWRFTPPTHVVAALLQALEEHRDEGGVDGRYRRYTRNRDALVGAMRRLGFETLLPDAWLSPIIVSFLNPQHPGFTFERFYTLMKDRGYVLYPGKLTEADTFRMGCIGRLDESVMLGAAASAGEALAEMGVPDGRPASAALAERNALAECQ